MPTTRATLTARPLPADTLPRAFLLFAPGINANYNADATGDPQPVFTARSAARLREAAERKGSDFYVDLEHLSLKSRAPGSTDAMAWFRVEVRPDGSCWAVNVRWTPEGARRLRALSQRYISPVFYFDRETGEVTEFVGVALTSDPATYGAAPLVAASRTPVPRLRLDALSARVPAELKIAFAVLAHKQGMTVSAGLRRLVERADAAMLARSKPSDLVRLCQLLGIPTVSTPEEIRDALEDFLAELPPGSPGSAAPDVPADPTVGTADPPKPKTSDPVAAARLGMTVARMGPVERDRYLRIQENFARNRRAQARRLRA